MATRVRAKFYVSQVGISSYDPKARSVKLQAVTRKTGDNAEFYQSTPSGSIEMQISNPDTAALFHKWLGRDMYVDFSLVDEEVRPDAYKQDPPA